MSLGLRVAVVLAAAVSVVALSWTISAETPLGTLEGRVVAQETGAPVSVEVSLQPVGVSDDEAGGYQVTSSKTGEFVFSRLPAGRYNLQVFAEVHSLPPTVVTIEEGKSQTIEVELIPGDPTFSLYVHQHIFTPDERPQVTCRGFVWRADAIKLRLYEVDPKRFLKDARGSIWGLFGLDPYDREGLRRVEIEGRPGLNLVGSFESRVTNRNSEGVFTERVNLPVLKSGFYLVEATAGGLRSLDWIMVTGLGLVTKTVGNSLLAYTVNLKTGEPTPNTVVEILSQGEILASGSTDTRGLVSLVSSTTESGPMTILARNGESYAFATTWADRRESANVTVYSYTDRPVYRPGQRVYFKSVTRRLASSSEGGSQHEDYKVEAGSPARVEVRDPRDNVVYLGRGKTDTFGSYYGHFDLNAEAATGYYTINYSVAGRTQESGFRVMSYRKPEFSVKVKFAKRRYLRGELVKAKVSAQYYFGTPVANAKVGYWVSRSPFWFFDSEDEWASDYEDYTGYGEAVSEGRVTTDENGEATIEFVADWPKPKENEPWDSDQLFTVGCWIADQSGQEADGSGSILATRGEFDINVQPTRYVAAVGDNVGADIILRYYNGKPVRNQEVLVQVSRENWLPRGEMRLDVLKRVKVRTDEDGRAGIEFKAAKAGDMRISASAVDRRRNTVTGTAYVWCWSDEYQQIEGTRYSDLQVVLDKKTYNPGDMAKVLINTSKPGPTALVTVEGDRIQFVKTVKLRSNSTTVDIPVLSSFKPNFYVGVCFVRNKRFLSQEARANVSLKGRELKLQVTPDKRTYRPGDKATYRIRATDPTGKPAVAQVSIGVVDEAIYAILEDSTMPILDYFYAHKPNAVNTNFSFPQIYLSDPDKAGSPSLKPEPRLRKRFRDTAFWAPAVVTNAQGEASVSFTLPDNLTTWRATVRGITANTLCGQTKTTVKTQQPLLVRLAVPRFMVQNDRATVSASVHNYSGRNQSVAVSLTAPGLDVGNESAQRISLKNGEVRRLDWNVTAPKSGEFSITVVAKGDTVGDAMQITLPVHPRGEERQSVTVGSLGPAGSGVETIIVRSDAVLNASKLRIRLAPSLASSMLGALDYLATYPYGCTEQTTSAFIPDVVLWKSFKNLGIMNPELQAKLPDMVQSGLYRLYRFELPDGGWSWCEYGDPDLWMTAYVCYGLIMARDAGFHVNPNVISRGLEQIRRTLARKHQVNEKNAFALYVLSLDGYDVGSWFEKALEQPYLTDNTLALAILALERCNRHDEAREALGRLFAKAVRQPGFLYWRGNNDWIGDSVEATALALKAVLAVDPNDSRAADIVRWLMRQRSANYWFSTRQTAFVIYALVDYLESARELQPDYKLTVKLNGRPLKNFYFGREAVWAPDRVLTVPASKLLKGRNTIAFSKSGQGNLYYSIELTQYVAKKTMPAVVTGSGLTVTREYFSSNRITGRSGPAITGCRTGDVILVRLTVRAGRSLDYALLEDFIPAGCEIVDRGNVDYWEWDYWYSGRDVRDNKISFYLDSVPVGKHIIEYRMRAGFSGTYHAPPAQVFAMYQPTVRTTTAESEFVIR